MNPLDSAELARRLGAFFDRPNPVLFAGAGVGSRVGFPDWNEFLELLAQKCDEYDDAASAALIRQRRARGQYLGAASVYKTCDSIPEGERWKGLADPFRRSISDDVLERLVPLVSLGFTGIVTTNYDHSLHHACARANARWVVPVERDSLRGASLNKELFIARVHGSAEKPTTMVVDTADYEQIKRDEAYLDFIGHIFSSRSCLFVGSSFLDPAIAHLLDLYEERFGPTFDALHSALVPARQDPLVTRLRKLNIDTLEYDGADGHAVLWRAIHSAARSRTARPREEGRELVRAEVGLGPIHRFMAFAYAQMRSKAAGEPILCVIQDGIVSSVLAQQPEKVITQVEIEKQVAQALRISTDEARRIVEESLVRLAMRDQILRDGKAIIWAGERTTDLEEHLAKLGRDVLDRMRVREGVRVSADDEAVARKVLETVLMTRAWDLAAHYAGAASGWTSDVHHVVRRVVSEESRERSISGPGAMVRAILDLLVSPDRQEADLLTALSRAAFGVQLVMSSPRQAVLHKYALPDRLYLDANVLMPAITAGHPLRPVYSDTIGRLTHAAEKAGSRFVVAVGVQFLNEIVSHRRLAIELVSLAELEDPDRLTQHVRFYRATNTNVFVGAYASFVGRGKTQVKFHEFLAQVAPYDSEEALAEHLARIGIHAVEMDFREKHNAEFARLFGRLRQAYEESADAILKGREAVLVEHEAQQLTQLSLDSDAGVRSLFVTADRRFRRALLTDSQLQPLASRTVSHLGLVAIADVMAGLETDTRSLARLMWALPTSDEEQTLFEYFVSLGLQNYREGMAMEMQQAAQLVAKEAAEAAEDESVPLFGEDAEDVARTAQFLDRFQERFFQHWRQAIEKREQSEP